MEQNNKKIGERIKELREGSCVNDMLHICEDALNYYKSLSPNKDLGDLIFQFESVRSILNNCRGQKISAETLGDILGVSRSSVIRCEAGEFGKKGEPPIKDLKLRLFALLTGTHLDYIKCYTDIKDQTEYQNWLRDTKDNILNDYRHFVAEIDTKLNAIFSLSGYSFDNIANVYYGLNDIDGSPKEYAGPYKLTKINEPTETIFLNESDLEGIIAQISRTVDFELYRIKKDRNNGNS